MKYTNAEWTEDMVEDRFKEAVRTLRRLYVPGTKPQGYFNGWPDMVYTAWELEMQEKLPLRLGPPAADAIDRMNETFEWLSWLDRVDERKIITMRAQGMRWKSITAALGCGRTHGWEIYKNALNKIVKKINNMQKRCSRTNMH